MFNFIYIVQCKWYLQFKISVQGPLNNNILGLKLVHFISSCSWVLCFMHSATKCLTMYSQCLTQQPGELARVDRRQCNRHSLFPASTCWQYWTSCSTQLFPLSHHHWPPGLCWLLTSWLMSPCPVPGDETVYYLNNYHNTAYTSPAI